MINLASFSSKSKNYCSKVISTDSMATKKGDKQPHLANENHSKIIMEIRPYSTKIKLDNPSLVIIHAGEKETSNNKIPIRCIVTLFCWLLVLLLLI